MTRAMFNLAILLLLAGCAGRTHPGPTPEQEELAGELAGRNPGPAKSCIPAQNGSSIVIVDSRTVVRRSGRTIWVNRLEGDCPGLRPLATVITEVHGSQHSRGDRVRGLDPGSTIPGPHCPLGDWVPYTTPR